VFIGNRRREGKSLRKEMKRLAARERGGLSGETPIINTNSVALP
jgi:hypothetical protein